MKSININFGETENIFKFAKYHSSMKPIHKDAILLYIFYCYGICMKCIHLYYINKEIHNLTKDL